MKDKNAREIAPVEAPSKAPTEQTKDTKDETLNSTRTEGQQTQQPCSQESNGTDHLAPRVLDPSNSIVVATPQDHLAENIGIFQQDFHSPPPTPAGQQLPEEQYDLVDTPEVNEKRGWALGFSCKRTGLMVKMTDDIDRM